MRNIKLLLFERKIGLGDKLKWLIFNYKQRRALKRSVKTFNTALAKGEFELDKKHREISNLPPQALKPKLNYNKNAESTVGKYFNDRL
jgi:hypothetical protein